MRNNLAGGNAEADATKARPWHQAPPGSGI